MIAGRAMSTNSEISSPANIQAKNAADSANHRWPVVSSAMGWTSDISPLFVTLRPHAFGMQPTVQAMARVGLRCRCWLKSHNLRRIDCGGPGVLG